MPGTDSSTDNVRVYRNDLLKIESYKYDSDSTLDDFKVSNFKYSVSKQGHDVGKSFNLNYSIFGKGCYRCESSSISSKMTVDGEAYVPSHDAPDYFVSV